MATQFHVGEKVGDYKILNVLGSGGVGRVFQVEHTVTRRVEAMKILLDHVAGDDEIGERFLQEVRVQASLNHPNIAAAYNAFYANGALVMVMEWAAGKSLRKLLDEGDLTFDTAVSYVCQVLAALEYAHGQGVVHRDVTPANIIIADNGQAKLTDFGLAKTQQDRRLTQTGLAMGSLHYMAPEQIRGLPNVDHRADIYAAGVVLYESLTGRKPFEAEDSFALMRAHVEEEPKPIALAKGASAEISDTVLRAMSKSPGDRFATAGGFRDALLGLIGDQGGIAGSTRGFHQSAIHNRPLVRLSIVGAVLTVLAFLSFQAHRIWPVLVPPTLKMHVRHAPPMPEFALKPPYLPASSTRIEAKHPVRRLWGRLSSLRRGHSRTGK